MVYSLNYDKGNIKDYVYFSSEILENHFQVRDKLQGNFHMTDDDDDTKLTKRK